MTDTPHYPEDDEISLLDLLQTIVDNLRLLVIGPLVAGLLAYGVSLVIAKTYESGFTLEAQKTLATDGVDIKPERISALAVAQPTLIAAAQTLTAANQPDLAKRILAGSAKSSVPRKTNQVLVTVQASTAQAAHDMAQALLSATLQASRPQGEELARLTQDLQKNQAALDNARTLEARLDDAIKQGKSSDEELAQNYAALLPAISAQTNQVEQNRARLAGLDESDIVTKPTVPSAPSKPRKMLVVLMTILATGFALLLFVFIRQAFRNASQNEESAPKINALQASWRKALGKTK